MSTKYEKKDMKTNENQWKMKKTLNMKNEIVKKIERKRKI